MPGISVFQETVLGIPLLTFLFGSVIALVLLMLLIACGFVLIRDTLTESRASGKSIYNEDSKDVEEFHEVV